MGRGCPTLLARGILSVARNSGDVTLRNAEKVAKGPHWTTSERFTSPIQTLLDLSCMPRCILSDSTINNLSLADVLEGREVPDPLFRSGVHFERCLASHSRSSLPAQEYKVIST